MIKSGSTISRSPAPGAKNIDHLVIIAGGSGTRLAHIAGDLPKVLVPIGGKPVLQHQLELAAAMDVRDVTIFTGYLSKKIADFVGDGSNFGLNVRILVEPEPLGTAGALLQSLDLLPDQFFVVYGDIMLAVDLRQFAQQHVERNADLTALVQPTDHPLDSDLLETDADNWVKAIHAYPHPLGQFFGNIANAALYVVRRQALRPWVGVSCKQDFTKDIMLGLLRAGAHVLAYRSGEYIRDMGTAARLERVQADWRAGRISIDEPGKLRPAIFLDRDGTLNVEKGFLRSVDELELLPGVGSTLRTLRQAGYRLVVLTNQPVIARGEVTEADVDLMHRRLEWELGKDGAYLDGIYVCPHHPDSGFSGERSELKVNCECRKPAIGLFSRSCRELKIDASCSWMIGDQTRDIEMARRAGLRSILVQTGMAGADNRFDCAPNHIAADLSAAANFILGQQQVSAP